MQRMHSKTNIQNVIWDFWANKQTENLLELKQGIPLVKFFYHDYLISYELQDKQSLLCEVWANKDLKSLSSILKRIKCSRWQNVFWVSLDSSFKGTLS